MPAMSNLDPIMACFECTHPLEKVHVCTLESPWVDSAECTGALSQVHRSTSQSGWVDFSKCMGALFLRHCGTVQTHFGRPKILAGDSIASMRIEG